MAAKDAILKALVEGAITELMVKTTAGNVYLPDGTTIVAGKLAEMVTSINERAKSADVTTEINTAVSKAIDDLVDGAPAAYDTLKEIADYLATHQDEYTALLTTIGGKAEKSTVDALKTTIDGLGALAAKDKVSGADLDTALAAKVNAAAQGNHSHANKTVLDGITADKVTGWDGKSKVTVGTAQPTDMKPGDLFIQIS
ncbi:hypothetical protein [Senimuribacter intestinalis]|uniref:hypothetical protein n=1 Tax=Senimuribacter intestinalis TaxID=2941507 RepID=UPI0020401713|nr:hypothetical protein [Senimuribacter intestinalis]